MRGINAFCGFRFYGRAPVVWLASVGGFWGQGGFLKLARVASLVASTWPEAVPRKLLISSRKSRRIGRGGFQLDSPVKKPRASEMARSAPPYTDRVREEPWEGATCPARSGPSSAGRAPRHRVTEPVIRLACEIRVGWRSAG